MAIWIPDSLALECLKGTHDFQTHTFKCALFDSNAGFTKESTTAYAAANEVSGTNYTAGGATATVSSGYPQFELIDGVYRASVRFDDVSWNSATFSNVLWALYYNATDTATSAVAAIQFNKVSAVVSGDFVISIPLAQWPIVNILTGTSEQS